MLLEACYRDDRVIAGDADHRCKERGQAAFSDSGGDLGSESACACGFVHDDAASGLCDRTKHRVFIIGLQRGEIDDLGSDALGGERFGRDHSLFQRPN